MQPPEVLSGGGPGEGWRPPSWLRWTALVTAVAAVLAVGGRSLLPQTGLGERPDAQAGTGPGAASRPALPPAGAALPPDRHTPGFSFVGRRTDPPGTGIRRYVQVSGRSLRPLAIPFGAALPSGDGRELFVSVDGERLYAVPLAAPSRARRIAGAATALGIRGDHLYVTGPDRDNNGRVQVRSRSDGRVLNPRYLPPTPGTVAVGIVDAGAQVAVILAAGPGVVPRQPGRLMLRWPDGEPVPISGAGRFLGSHGGIAVIAPDPAECGQPARRCLQVLRPGPFKQLRGATVSPPRGWTVERGRPIGFAAGGVVFTVSSGGGPRAYAIAWPSSLTGQLVPGSLGAVPERGLVTDRRYVVWAVDDDRLGPVPVYWDATRPAERARRTDQVLPAGFRFVCLCGP